MISPLMGGLQFQGEEQFILPQVLIEQQNGETLVSVFVETNELDSAKTILNSLKNNRTFTAQSINHRKRRVQSESKYVV